MPPKLASMGGKGIVFLSFLIPLIVYLVIQAIPVGKKAVLKEELSSS
jgi:hypothetical protein